MTLRRATRADSALLAALHAQHFPRAWTALEFESFFERDGVIGLIAEADVDGCNTKKEGRMPDSALSLSHRGGQETAAGDKDKNPAGFIFCWAVAGECELLCLAVQAPFRRHGLARRLCETAMREARRLGAQTMHLEVAVGNLPARALYEALGFTMTRRRSAYYRYPDGSSEDAVTMRCELYIQGVDPTGVNP